MNLVLLHGINNTAKSFDAIRAALPKEIDAHAPDLTASDSVDEIAERLLPDLPKRFVLAGHSFGGYVALALLDMVPERIEGVILIGSNTKADSNAVAQMRLARADEAEAGGYCQLAEAATAMTFHPDSLIDSDLMAFRTAELLAYGAERFAAHQRACAARPDRTKLLTSYKGPKRFIAGEGDAVMPLDGQRAMAGSTGADLRVVQKAGHMLVCERPLDVAKALILS